jgi:phenylalanyl-tRNA synthetase alpha chain
VAGPEVETVEYNFTKLNTPLDHPAADMHDTFYLSEGVVLRTHTSPVQARVMERSRRRCAWWSRGWRSAATPTTPSHAPAFAQIEGLAVDEGITFRDFKATISEFVRRFFGPTRRRASAPRSSPSPSPRRRWTSPAGSARGGCSACKHTGWMEIMGAGMVHPNVFAAVGYDAERYTGYAFGMGPARIAMQRYGLPDIRLLYEGDVRFLGSSRGEVRDERVSYGRRWLKSIAPGLYRGDVPGLGARRPAGRCWARPWTRSWTWAAAWATS